MSNNKIVVTTAAAIASLLAGLGNQAQATVPPQDNVPKETIHKVGGTNSPDVVLQGLMYRMEQENHSIILQRSEAGILYAGHGSHASHASHASHGSHRSGR
jgi:hypothetical protein